jgi:hypothetical protein
MSDELRSLERKLKQMERAAKIVKALNALFFRDDAPINVRPRKKRGPNKPKVDPKTGLPVACKKRGEKAKAGMAAKPEVKQTVRYKDGERVEEAKG